ncbi:hypothetical protein E3P99_01460 [Wallemia hederae]|uniref:Dephospho-CoA kinase n=1 Tax=Wallemia hederae TaxID=1540922 RepID=A0A4T0FUL6_9BASI|nr:hypothetical protein E3P99_01460 [Wallemia hederae]
MLVVGLTGGISTGKSTVTQRLREEHKIKVVDLDAVARQVVEPHTPALRQIVDRYGKEVLRWDDKTQQEVLDRPSLGKILFNDKAEKKWIEGVLHPAILKRTAWEVLKAYASLHSIVVLDVPLLFEATLHRYVGLAALVYCSPQTQLQRLMARDSVSKEEAEKKMAAQFPIDDKVSLADQVIHNDGTREDTHREVAMVVQQWRDRTRWWYVVQWLCPPLAAAQAAWIIWSKKKQGESKGEKRE